MEMLLNAASKNSCCTICDK